MSRTNIDLDDKILKKAGKLTHLKTKKEIVNYAMEELVRMYYDEKTRKIF